MCNFLYFLNSTLSFQLFLALSCDDLLYWLLSWKLNILYTHYFTILYTHYFTILNREQ